MMVTLLVGGRLIVNQAGATARDEIEWGYEGDIGPDFWGDLDPSFAKCKDGLAQSPINLDRVIDRDLPVIVFNYGISAAKVFNNGHTVEVEVDPGASIVSMGREYHLEQFHWHAPSEHTIGQGAHYDMELHLVHENDLMQKAVVGVLIRRGKENEALKKIWEVLPTRKGEEHDLEHLKLTARDLLPEDPDYYFYDGSLTTPACNEGVLWHVMATPVEMSAEQIIKFIDALRSCCHRNDRPTQPLNNRLVYRRVH
jgi:carbonic anhydrase